MAEQQVFKLYQPSGAQSCVYEARHGYLAETGKSWRAN
jgi:hypothetical protein